MTSWSSSSRFLYLSCVWSLVSFFNPGIFSRLDSNDVKPIKVVLLNMLVRSRHSKCLESNSLILLFAQTGNLVPPEFAFKNPPLIYKVSIRNKRLF